MCVVVSKCIKGLVGFKLDLKTLKSVVFYKELFAYMFHNTLLKLVGWVLNGYGCGLNEIIWSWNMEYSLSLILTIQVVNCIILI